jgi:hypothetical protein
VTTPPLRSPPSVGSPPLNRVDLILITYITLFTI